MKILMTGGGTGGHVYPAIAIAETLKAKFPDVEIAFVGTSKGIENKICRSAGYPIYHIKAQGIKRSLSPSNIKALLIAKFYPYKTRKLIREFAPDIVIGTGGYVCWSPCMAAVMEGVPTILHESNVYPGLTVRKLQKKVDKILLNFADSAKYLSPEISDRLITVGNPIRMGFSVTKPEDARALLGISEGKKMLLSYGGSRGAGRINEIMIDFMKRFAPANPNVIHVHATGDIGADTFMKRFAEEGLDKLENIRVCRYIEDMPVKMAAADLVICRAGAMTLSEISMMRKAAIFIPSPNVADNHQYKNAKLLSDNGAAMLIEEKDLTPEGLDDSVTKLLSNDSERRSMAQRAGDFYNPNANKQIYDEIIRIINQRMK